MRFKSSEVWGRALCALIGAAALVPIARLAFILWVNGSNVPTNDACGAVLNFLGPALSPGYHWSRIARDTFMSTHSNILPGLTYYAFARLTHLNAYAMMYFGLLLAGAKLAVTHSALTAGKGVRWTAARMAMLAMLSGLIFSVSLISTYEQDWQSLKSGYCELGFALGVLALARFRMRWPGVVLASAGGIAASFSFAAGLATWPIFAGAMVLYGWRKVRHFAFLIVSGAVAASPYFYFLLLERSAHQANSHLISLLNVRLIADLIGRPFGNSTGITSDPMRLTEAAGVAGIGLAAAGGWLLWKRGGWKDLDAAIPSVMFICFALLASWQITLFRGAIAPWYIVFGTNFWIGLAGLCYLTWVSAEADASGGEPAPPGRESARIAIGLQGRRSRTGEAARRDWLRGAWAESWAPKAWAGGSALLIAGFLVFCNRTHGDKSFYLESRSPVAASMLRHYRTAPTYAEDYLALWPARHRAGLWSGFG